MTQDTFHFLLLHSLINTVLDNLLNQIYIYIYISKRLNSDCCDVVTICPNKQLRVRLSACTTGVTLFPLNLPADHVSVQKLEWCLSCKMYSRKECKEENRQVNKDATWDKEQIWWWITCKTNTQIFIQHSFCWVASLQRHVLPFWLHKYKRHEGYISTTLSIIH